MKPLFSRVLICDDHPICVLGIETALRDLYGEAIEIRKATNAGEVLRSIEEYGAPDLLIVDLGLPDIPGAELIRQLEPQRARMNILVLTGSDNLMTLSQVLSLNIQGLMNKTSSMDQWHDIFAFMQENPKAIYLDAAVEKILHRRTDVYLTKREFEVLELIVKGHTSKEIAEVLGCSTETIKSHRSNIMEKIDVRNTAEMTAWYLEGNARTKQSLKGL